MNADLTAQFEAVRSHLQAVALRMLGSRADAEDAVQEAWLRLERADAGDILNLHAWLTTVVARHCLDVLRTRKRRPRGEDNAVAALPGASDTEAEVTMADSVGAALLLVLDSLSPAERLAFVLHDLFAIPFDDIAAMLQRTPESVRQLASRARRRVQGGQASVAERDKQRKVVAAFIAAARDGDFAALVTLLHPDAQIDADAAARAAGAPMAAHGAESIATALKGRAKGGHLCLIDGVPGGVWLQKSRVVAAFVFTLDNDLVKGIRMVMGEGELQELDIEFL